MSTKVKFNLEISICEPLQYKQNNCINYYIVSLRRSNLLFPKDLRLLRCRSQ
ncbi:hypothetical protein KsCSTR_28490 [Candidatus Kuenenia stuttgartiensis]|uniref:Uncharacterized protein n=1 Tax=Kuenenia stuttgartiensis TaxID=174633 RepID=A0A6G7GRL9_KUEST|nr:hypothetical protein KsCSTR_28490 [Candidatus Kuenenia stuttgartiensis]